MAKIVPKDARVRKSYNLYLGVDGGGTKTNIAIANTAGEIVGESVGGPSNPLRIGVEPAVANIVKAVDTACDISGVSRGDIVAATLGLAGVRRTDIRERVCESFIDKLRIRDTTVTTDASIALYGTTLGKPGVVVIAGTGSVSLGIDSEGHTAMAGGWGPIAGDEGGGRGIAERALHSIAKASDGRGERTKLSDEAADYFRASNAENLIGAIYAPKMDNSRIAGFARQVIETALEGDKIAVEIISEAGNELGVAAAAVIRRLGLEKRAIPIGCVGSIFNAGDLLTGPMADEIHKTAPKAYLTQPQMIPSHAAALMALSNGKNGVKI
jgi:N-acetylglucosamine kinase-like BadF-type ATPase